MSVSTLYNKKGARKRLSLVKNRVEG
jgi:hypothetical protein